MYLKHIKPGDWIMHVESKIKYKVERLTQSGILFYDSAGRPVDPHNTVDDERIELNTEYYYYFNNMDDDKFKKYYVLLGKLADDSIKYEEDLPDY